MKQQTLPAGSSRPGISIPFPKILIWLLIVAAVMVGARMDAGLYSGDIGRVISVTDHAAGTKTGGDDNHDYTEHYYTQTLRVRLLNGSCRGQEALVTNEYTRSGVYDTKYAPGNQIFIGSLTKNKAGDLSGTASGMKRDWLILGVLTALFGLFLLVGGRRGALTIFSLILNMIAFAFVLHLYTKGYNILMMMIPLVIFFTWMLLFFMYGRNERTKLAFLATLTAASLTTLIAFIALNFGGRIDYDFMDYLSQPYSQADANMIFLSEILVGCLGAVMDVVVTIVATVSEIADTGGDLSPKSLFRTCRTVGDDLVGTMISLMLFTNMAGALPIILLSLRNGIAFHTILRYNIFFDTARFLTGSIGVVLAIPAASLIAVRHYRMRTQKGGENA